MMTTHSVTTSVFLQGADNKWKVQSSLPRFSDKYTLSATYAKGDESGTREGKFEKYVVVMVKLSMWRPRTMSLNWCLTTRTYYVVGPLPAGSMKTAL